MKYLVLLRQEFLHPTCHFTKSATVVSQAVFTCLRSAESPFKLNGTVLEADVDLWTLSSEFSVLQKNWDYIGSRSICNDHRNETAALAQKLPVSCPNHRHLQSSWQQRRNNTILTTFHTGPNVPDCIFKELCGSMQAADRKWHNLHIYGVQYWLKLQPPSA